MLTIKRCVVGEYSGGFESFFFSAGQVLSGLTRKYGIKVAVGDLIGHENKSDLDRWSCGHKSVCLSLNS